MSTNYRTYVCAMIKYSSTSTYPSNVVCLDWRETEIAQNGY